MSPSPSLGDAKGPPSNKNDIRPLETSLHGAEAVTLDEDTLIDTDTTVNKAATVDAAVTGGKAAAADPGIRRRLLQQTRLISTHMECSATGEIESPILTSNYSSVEPLKISDLPNELLDNIMFQFSGRAEKYHSDHKMCDFPSTSKQDIKNVRLSCRTLNTTASRYLVQRIRVELSLKSLSRFEKVCNHPLIRHGVRTVHICLAQYDDAFDNNLEGFIRHHKEEIDLEEKEPEDELVSHTWGKYLEALAAQDHKLPGRFAPFEVRLIQALLEGYRLYQCGLQEQKLLQDGSFAARVSASMANLPFAKHLQLTDWDTLQWGQPSSLEFVGGSSLHLSSNESIVRGLAHYRNPFNKIRGNKLLKLVPNLICANITSLDIRITSSVSDYTELSLLSPQESQLRSNLINLRFFRFESYEWICPDPPVDQPGLRPLAHFLDACLKSESLEHLFIDANLRGLSPEGSLISHRPWHRLKSAVLKDLPASEADLDVLTKSIASKSDGSLTLSRVHLYCGATWASVLDLLRAKRIRVSLNPQCGAEFQTHRHLVQMVFSRHRQTPIHRLQAFTEHDAWGEGTPIHFLPSFAEYYVRGEDMPNPMLKPPDQELREKLLGFVPNDDGGPNVQGNDQ